MRKILNFLIIMSLSLSIVACSGANSKQAQKFELKDGVYLGQSSPDERGGIIKVQIEIKDSKIVDCTMENIDGDGNIKDENYGKSINEGLYKIAQEAIHLAESYPQDLVAAGSIEGVDAISGATESYNQFVEACKNALVEK